MPDDFGDVRDFARAALQAVGLDDQVDGAGDLLPHGLQRQLEAGHHDHRFETGDGVARRVGVQRGQRAFVAGVHGLQHVERFGPRHSPMMMRSGRIRRALRTRSVAVIAPLPSMFGGRVSSRTTWSCCNCNSAASSIVTMRSSFGMKLDSVLSSVVLPEPVPPEMMMFSRALMRAFQQHHHLGREGLVVEQVFQLERIGAEAANGDRGAVQGQRRNDRVHAGAVRQAGVDHRADFVDAAADLRHDAVDDLHQVLVVAEL